MRYRTLESPIEISATIEGPADEVLTILRKVGHSSCRLRAAVSCKIISLPSRRWYEANTFPLIEDGDATKAMERLDSLARQRLVEPDIERELDMILPTLRDMTR